MSSKEFSTLEIDAIGEILNISLGSSATALSTMLSARVDITTPQVKVVEKSKFEFEDLEPAIGVEITYIEGLRGSNIMLLKRMDVKIIVEMMMGMEIPEEEFELNEINLSAICEAMNQMMGASSTALSEFLGETVNISTPTSSEIGDVHAFKEKYFAGEEVMVCVEFFLRIGDNLESKFMNLMPTDLAKKLVSGFLPDLGEEETSPEPAAAPEPEPAPAPAEEGSNKMMSQEEIEALLAGNSAPEEPAAEESSNKMMSQEEIEALLAGDSAPAEPAAEESSNKMMSQEEIEALLGGDSSPAPAAAAQPAPQPAPAAPQPAVAQQAEQPQAMVQQPVMQQPMMQQPVANALTEQMMAQMTQMTQMMSQMQQVMVNQMQQAKEAPQRSPKTLNVHPLPTNSLNAGGTGEEQEENMDMILGVPLEVSVEIGRTRKLVKDILEFTKGSLVVLDKVAGEQVDLFVNGQCIAKGDVVVVEDNFGIRITEILAEDIAAIE